MAWTEKYLNLGATNNGDGTASNDAASGGAAGAWNTWANAVTGLGTISVPTRVNVKGTLSLSAATTLSTAGTSTTNPLWWRGYNTTAGDIDADNSLTKPSTSNNNSITVSTGNQLFSGLSFTGSSTSVATLIFTAANPWLHRCRVTATGANSNSFAVALPAAAPGPAYFTASEFVANAVANMINAQGPITAVGCYFHGGKDAISSNTTVTAVRNVMGIVNGFGILGTVVTAIDNSIYQVGGKTNTDGIRFTTASGSSMLIGNIIANFNGTGNNAINSSGGSSLSSRLLNNAFYNCTNSFNNIVEAHQYLSPGTAGVLASDPYTNAAGNDLSIGTVAKAMGFPGAFENASFIGYMDLGAVQRQEPAGTSMGNFYGELVNL